MAVRAGAPFPVWVIGAGNELRGDDGAGVAVARLVGQSGWSGVHVVETTGAGLNLLEYWQPERWVWLVDAAVIPGIAPGHVYRWNIHSQPLPRVLWQGSGHTAGVATAMALAEALGWLPRQLIVYAIAGARFDLGTGLSPSVARAVDHVARRIGEEVAELAAVR